MICSSNGFLLDSLGNIESEWLINERSLIVIYLFISQLMA